MSLFRILPAFSLVTSQRPLAFVSRPQRIVMILALLLILFSGSARADDFLGMSPTNPIKVDPKERTVRVLAEVNGRYLSRPLVHHALVYKGGRLAYKSLFKALVDHKTFHDSLVLAGYRPGNNMTMDNMAKTNVEGDLLQVTVTWKGAGKEYNLNDVIKDSNGKAILVRFGGNLSRAVDKGTGCLICLESCPVGITSNAQYTYGAIEKRQEVVFTANKAVLPPDGSLVLLTFRKAP